MEQRYLANLNFVPLSYTQQCLKGVRAEDPFYPRFWEERIEEIKPSGAWWDTLGGRQGRGIFVCDMGELFGDWLPYKWQEQVFDAIKSDPLDRFYLLTKQPQNLIKWSPFPSNCFVGVTATNQDMYDSAVYHLGRIQARIRYISLEPLLSPIHLPNYKDVDWLILGGKSGKDKFYPPEDWIQKIEAVIDRLGISTFIFEKLNLRKTWDKPPRQELP